MIRSSWLVANLPRLRRAFDAERGLRSCLQPCGGNVFATARTYTVSAIFYPIQSPLNRCDLARYKQRLRFKRGVIFGFDRPFRRVGIKGLRQISFKVREARLQLTELRLEAGLCGGCVCHDWNSETVWRRLGAIRAHARTYQEKRSCQKR